MQKTVDEIITVKDYEMEQMINQILEGIIQNICMEMDRKQITVRGLGEMSCVNYSHLSRMFCFQTRIGLTTLIKIAYALHVRPSDLFPPDVNRKKTNGQRFEEITKGMDIESCNSLLDMCVNYTREWQRIREK